MRVIAGSARRLLLETPEGLDTRPTTDRIKETLFNILQPQLPGCRFLDLFAGSGGIGIEALSRGAAYAVFVDNGREAVRCIKANLAHTRLSDRAQVIAADVQAAISRLASAGETFDIIHLDAPYGSADAVSALKSIADRGLAKDGESLVILEAAIDYSLPEEILSFYRVDRIKEYKTNKHYFMRKKEGTDNE